MNWYALNPGLAQIDLAIHYIHTVACELVSILKTNLPSLIQRNCSLHIVSFYVSAQTCYGNRNGCVQFDIDTHFFANARDGLHRNIGELLQAQWLRILRLRRIADSAGGQKEQRNQRSTPNLRIAIGLSVHLANRIHNEK
jgi:hypothetical protein